MAEKDRDLLKKQLLLWDIMSKEERAALGEPETLRAWAERNSRSVRTVTYWREEAGYQAERERLLAQRAARVAAGLEEAPVTRTVGVTAVTPDFPVPAPVEVDPNTSNVDLFANLVRQMLVQANQGDKVAIDFIKSPAVSKPLLDAINGAEDESDFPDQSDEDLVDMILDSFPELVVERARAKGLL